MAEKMWKDIKTIRCSHVGCDVELEVEEIYPAEFYPDQSPRLGAHRCSHGIQCSLMDKQEVVDRYLPRADGWQ